LVYRFRSFLIINFKPVTSLFIIFIFATVIEYKFLVNSNFYPGQGYAYPAYTRLSLLIFCCAVLILFLRVKRSGGKLIEFMSNNSLGLYCIHPFLLVFAGLG